MADHSSREPPRKILDPHRFLGITPNPDGTLTRRPRILTVPPSSSTASYLTKDVPLDSANKTFLRIFRPRVQSRDPLPVLVYFHGGGFVLFSATSSPFHDACAALTVRLPAVVVSVEYRHAPEHRLPAAYHDALAALRWLSSSDDPFLRGTSLQRCFLVGTSAGGNIAYRTALRASPAVKVEGVVMNQPYFGGEERTESEARSEGDKIIPLGANDLLWWLALPEGADRDHVYCNPMVETEEEGLIRRLPRCLVIGYGGDPLVDRQKRFVEMLREKGVHVAVHFEEGGYHGVDLYDSVKAGAVYKVISDFVASSTSLGDQPKSNM